MPERNLEFSSRRREIALLSLVLSLVLHVALYFALRGAAPPPWPTEATSSALFGVTFEVDTLPRASEAATPSAPPVAASSPAALAASAGASLPEETPPARDVSVEPASSEDGPRLDVAPKAEPKVTPKPLSTPKVIRDPESKEGGSKPRAKAADPIAPSTSAGSAEQSVAPAGTYGQEGVASARASLYAAFVRTLPLAGKLLPGWLEAPPGQKSKVLVELRVDGSGRLQEVQIVRGDTKSLLARTALKNEAFLSRGTFAIRGEQEGQMLIELSSEVEEREPSEEEDARARVVALGQRIPPSPPGRPPTGAYFTYGNGRHIELSAAMIELSR